MARRRHRGEGSVYRKCGPRYGCPDPEPVTLPSGAVIQQRPDHTRTCKAPWAQSIDLGLIGGRRVRRTATAKSKADLTEKVAALKAKMALGITPDATTTTGEWLTYWLDRVAPTHIRPTTLPSYRSKVTRYIIPAVGHIKLQDLRPEHVESMQDWMRTLTKIRNPGKGDPLSDTTIRQAHMILQSALADARRRGMVIRNAADVVTAPPAADRPHGHLRLAQAKAVLRTATTERELCRLVTALALGLRQGEALGLRWDDYKGAGPYRTLAVEEAIARVDGKLIRTEVKSRASHRLVPIPERMVPIFEAWREKAPNDPYIFPGWNGGPEDPKRDWIAWREALARASVPHIPLHGARGSAASLLADMGVPDWRIAEILGHSQVKVTRRHYIEGTEESHRAAIGGLVGELLD